MSETLRGSIGRSGSLWPPQWILAEKCSLQIFELFNKIGSLPTFAAFASKHKQIFTLNVRFLLAAHPILHPQRTAASRPWCRSTRTAQRRHPAVIFDAAVRPVEGDIRCDREIS
jgi:hypothetical protein